ncbi:type II toxin-antitoxin system RelB/DinJ family antitoxin [Syntrophomonas wolfei]|jgi:DNA-damage-inducible protein J|uniref:type II toxin-antitoxin system RelB/DinJ family antitoxin n=2 Tax=Syntrophomonas wolfei TaxID=863 RepID=UPI0039C8D193
MNIAIGKGSVLMTQINVNIRMDENLKKQFEAFCSEIGMNMTTAFCVFAKTAVRQNRIPFEISAESDPFYSEANQARLRKAIADLNAGKGKAHEIIEVTDE